MTPFPRPTSASSSGASSVPQPNLSALMAAGVDVSAGSNNPTGTSIENNSVHISTPVFYLALQPPLQSRPESTTIQQGDQLYCFQKPPQCVCSVLLDGGLLVASQLLNKHSKSCPELNDSPTSIVIAGVRHRKRPASCNSTKQEGQTNPQNHLANCAVRNSSQNTDNPLDRRRRQRSSGNRFVPATFPVLENPPCDEESVLPEISVSNAAAAVPRKMRRRRTGAVENGADEDDEFDAANEKEGGCDSGISNTSSESVPRLVIDETKQLLHDVEEEPQSQTQSTKSYIERRRRRRIEIQSQRGGAAPNTGETPSLESNVFKHLLNVLESILDISLLKDIRFWIILFGNLLLMITFLLLPLNADVLKTIRALDTMNIEEGGIIANHQPSNDYIVDTDTAFLNMSEYEYFLLQDQPPIYNIDGDEYEPVVINEPMPHMYAILLSVCGCAQTIVRAVAGFFADYPRADATIIVISL